MQETAPTSSAITDDLLCIRCRYNLRSLAGDGMCPECGLTIAKTIAAQTAWPDDAWLRLVTIGLNIAFGAVAVMPVSFAAAMASGDTSSGPIIGFLLAMVPLAMAVAVFLLTMREPLSSDPSTRRVTRYAAIAWPLMLYASLAAGIAEVPPRLIGGMLIASLIILGVTLAGAAHWTAHIARRVRRPILAISLCVLLWIDSGTMFYSAIFAMAWAGGHSGLDVLSALIPAILIAHVAVPATFVAVVWLRVTLGLVRRHTRW